jgi:hypothetical protein
LSAEEESKLLSLTKDQRRIIAENDRKSKNEYLTQAPNINHPTVKSHEKYKSFTDFVTNLNKGEVAKK